MDAVGPSRFKTLMVNKDNEIGGGLIFFRGRLPRAVPFTQESSVAMYRSEDGQVFVRFQPSEKHRILTCDVVELDVGHWSIDLYYYNPSFRYAVHKALTKGKKRVRGKGKIVGWGQHVMQAWEGIERAFAAHGVDPDAMDISAALETALWRHGVYKEEKYGYIQQC